MFEKSCCTLLPIGYLAQRSEALRVIAQTLDSSPHFVPHGYSLRDYVGVLRQAWRSLSVPKGYKRQIILF